jgi:hypothetical protein
MLADRLPGVIAATLALDQTYQVSRVPRLKWRLCRQQTEADFTLLFSRLFPDADYAGANGKVLSSCPSSAGCCGTTV